MYYEDIIDGTRVCNSRGRYGTLITVERDYFLVVWDDEPGQTYMHQRPGSIRPAAMNGNERAA